MEFRRIKNLPPYVFSIINGLKIEARRAGADVIDLGFGNPDIPSPDIAVEKLAEAAHNPKNHRYSLSRGLPKLREAIAGYYKNKWDVDLDTELEITNTIGSKEGFSHLMWVLLDRGDAAIVPSPSYPIHIYGPLFAGADLRQVPDAVPRRPVAARALRRRLHGQPADRLGRRLAQAAGARDLVPAQPDRCLRRPAVHAAGGRLLSRARDDRRARLRLRRRRLRRLSAAVILQAEGAKECAVELYSMTKSFSMAGWRSAFLLGNAEVVQALVKLKSYLDYGMFQPVQIAATVTLNEAADFPKEVCAIYERRRDALIDGLDRIGWDIPKPGGSMFVWAPIPEPYSEMDSVEFCSLIVRERDVALSPGVGFGPGGEGFVRFALIENEQRIQQAIRNLKRGLPKLG